MQSAMQEEELEKQCLVQLLGLKSADGFGTTLLCDQKATRATHRAFLRPPVAEHKT